MNWKLIKQEYKISAKQIDLLMEIMEEGCLSISDAHESYSKKDIADLVRRRFITYEHSLDMDYYELDNEGLALFFL